MINSLKDAWEHLNTQHILKWTRPQQNQEFGNIRATPSSLVAHALVPVEWLGQKRFSFKQVHDLCRDRDKLTKSVLSHADMLPKTGPINELYRDNLASALEGLNMSDNKSNCRFVLTGILEKFNENEEEQDRYTLKSCHVQSHVRHKVLSKQIEYINQVGSDYGYCDWLFDLAFQPFLSALNFSILLVTAKSSSCPPDRFFRIDLHGRSYQVSHPNTIFRSAFR
jgi:hypothetical protein